MSDKTHDPKSIKLNPKAAARLNELAKNMPPGKVETHVPAPMPMIRHKDARLLREALANVFHKAPPIVKQKIHDTLLAYAEAVKPYCECLDRSWCAGENKFACLDCGARFSAADSLDKVAFPPQAPVNFVAQQKRAVQAVKLPKGFSIFRHWLGMKQNDA